MPLLAERRVPIPTTDILSWCWANRNTYAQNRPIFIDCANVKNAISAEHAYSLIRKLIAGFRHAGLRKGDCVCIHSFNNLYYPILVQAIIGAGGCFVGTNPGYTSHELRHVLKLANVKLVIAEPELLTALEQPAAELGIDAATNFFVFDAKDAHRTIPSYRHWRTLLEHGEEDWIRFDDLHTAQTTNAFLLFSSGTTGLPKAAQVSHYNLIAQHTLVYEDPARPWPFITSGMICCLPFFHAALAPQVHISSLRSGMVVYVMPRFDMVPFLENLKRFDVKWQTLVPPLVVGILNYARQNPTLVKEAFSGILATGSGAAPLDKDTANNFRSYLPPGSTFTQVWAMSETSSYASRLLWPEDDDTGSVGRFLPNLDIKLVNVEDGVTELWPPYDVRGELCIRGPTVIRGYLDDPEANSRDWDGEGYFHTGDILYCDGKTKLWYVVDRKKELIKVRGFQVAPSELEGVLLSHSGIADAAVIGVNSEGGTELPRAYIVRTKDARVTGGLTESEVRAWMEPRLAKYKQLTGGIVFVDTIPKSASGKILKRLLREQAKRELAVRL